MSRSFFTRGERPLHYVAVTSGKAKCGALWSRIRYVSTLSGWATAVMEQKRLCPTCAAVVSKETGATGATP